MLPEDYRESEAPRADEAQALAAAVFFAVWAADSFWLRWTTGPAAYIPGTVRTTLFVALALLGGYLSWSAHRQVFGVVRREAELVDYGVFRLSRHPMYFGVMLIYLGLAVSSMSAVTFAVLAMVFLLYNYLASYEEKKLIEFFGERYMGYMRKVRRWI